MKKNRLLLSFLLLNIALTLAKESASTPLSVKCNDFEGKEILALKLNVDSILVSKDDYHGIPYQNIIHTDFTQKRGLKQFIVEQKLAPTVVSAKGIDIQKVSSAKTTLKASFFNEDTETPSALSIQVQVTDDRGTIIDLKLANAISVFYLSAKEDHIRATDLYPSTVGISLDKYFGELQVDRKKNSEREELRPLYKFQRLLCSVATL